MYTNVLFSGVSSTDTHNYSGTYEHVMNDHPPYITSSPTRLHSPSSTRLLGGNRSGSAQTEHHTDSEGEISSRMEEEIPLNPAPRRMSSPYLDNRGSSVHYGGGGRRSSYLMNQQSCDSMHQPNTGNSLTSLVNSYF